MDDSVEMAASPAQTSDAAATVTGNSNPKDTYFVGEELGTGYFGEVYKVSGLAGLAFFAMKVGRGLLGGRKVEEEGGGKEVQGREERELQMGGLGGKALGQPGCMGATAAPCE